MEDKIQSILLLSLLLIVRVCGFFMYLFLSNLATVTDDHRQS